MGALGRAVAGGPAAEAQAPALPGWGWLVVALVGAGTLAVAVLAAQNPALAALPPIVAGAAIAVVRSPLRWSGAALLLALLAVDGPGDAAGLWHTPLLPIGEFLRLNVDRWVPGVRVSGLEVVILALLALAAHRRMSHARIDAPAGPPMAALVGDFALIYLLGFLFAELNGLARGGVLAPWKIRNIVQIPLLVMFFAVAFRGPADHRLLGRVIVLSALVKAAMAAWIQYVVAPGTGGHFEYATSHADSVLFAIALCVPIVRLAEAPSRRRLHEAALLVPALLVGMIANGRRIGWVMLAFALLAFWWMSGRQRWKRTVARVALALAPILALYVAVGWTHTGFFLFSPLQTLRTLTDATVDLSKLWRDIEDWNLAMCIRQSPVIGIGLGQEYSIYMPAADLSAFFPEYRAWPHNSVLGLLLFGGWVGFTAMWLLYPLTVLLAARAYRRSADPGERVAAQLCVAAAICCMVLAYGDLGANFVQHRLALALALATAARLPHVKDAAPRPSAAPG